MSVLTVAITGALCLPSRAQACAVCIGWPDAQGPNTGFYWSALLLTALPFVIVVLVGAWIAWAMRRVRPEWPEAARHPEVSKE